MNNAQIIAASRGVHKKDGNGFYMLKCPCHDDKKPSLGIKDGDNGFVLFHCFSGCGRKDVADYFKNEGFNVSGEKNVTPIKQPRKEVKRYQYISSDGEFLFDKIRYDDKTFAFQNKDGWGDGGKKGELYNAQYLNHLKGEVVYIVEGEKDVDTMTSIGLLSCTSGGASSWPSKNNKLFAGANVRIIPDNDEPGRNYAKMIRESLEGTAENIKIMFCPAPHKDVSDWVEAGATADDIEALFNVHKFKTMSFKEILERSYQPKWLIHNYFEENSLNQIFGASGSGKSFFALDMAYCIATGKDFFGRPTKKGSVLFIAGEGFSGFTKRSKALVNKYGSEDVRMDFSLQATELINEEACQDVADRIRANDDVYDAVFIDTLNRNMGAGDENSTKDMTAIITNIDKYFRNLGCAVIIVHHTGLTNLGRARGSGSMYNALNSEFKVTKDDVGMMEVTCTKQKEGEALWTENFRLQPVVIGYSDDTGEAIYSCVVNKADTTPKDVLLNRTQEIVFEALKYAISEHGLERSIHEIDVLLIDEDTWSQFAHKELDGRNKKRTFDRAKDHLVEIGYVSKHFGMYCVNNQ